MSKKKATKKTKTKSQGKVEAVKAKILDFKKKQKNKKKAEAEAKKAKADLQVSEVEAEAGVESEAADSTTEIEAGPETEAAIEAEADRLEESAPEAETKTEEAEYTGDSQIMQAMDSTDGPALPELEKKTGLDQVQLKHLQGAIETILYMAPGPLSLTKLRQLVDEQLPLKVYKELMKVLRAQFEKPEHGIALEEVSQGFQFRTKPGFSKYIQAVHKVIPVKLTKSALEVLSVVAYRQPATKPQIDDVRGVDSSHGLRVLLEKRMVKISGRSDAPGRPALYSTTQDFLEFFGLRSIQDLPSEDEIKSLMPSSEVDPGTALRALVKEETELEFAEDLDLDAIRDQIKGIKTSTTFTDALKQQDKLAGKKTKNEDGDVIKPKSAFDVLGDMVETKLAEEEQAVEEAATEEIPESTAVENEAPMEEVSAEAAEISALESEPATEESAAELSLEDAPLSEVSESPELDSSVLEMVAEFDGETTGQEQLDLAMEEPSGETLPDQPEEKEPMAAAVVATDTDEGTEDSADPFAEGFIESKGEEAVESKDVFQDITEQEINEAVDVLGEKQLEV